jgi:excisionase family DNA binding protein
MRTNAAAQTRTRLTLTVEEVAATLGISRAFAYEAVRRGEIPSIRIGRRVLVPRAALERLIDGDNALPPTA